VRSHQAVEKPIEVRTQGKTRTKRKKRRVRQRATCVDRHGRGREKSLKQKVALSVAGGKKKSGRGDSGGGGCKWHSRKG